MLLATSAVAHGQVNELIAVGDVAWERRAEGHADGRAKPGPINQAIEVYEEALALAPDDLEPRWKLMRALFFLGEHVEVERAARLETFARGRQLGEEAIDRFAEGVGGRKKLLALPSHDLRRATEDPSEVAEIFFWSAVQTGLWGRTRGKMASAREGVASKIRDYATLSVALNPMIENGGGHRVLGRLHTEAPKIPFITGWIDRDVAIAELETCRTISPDDLTTRLYLAEALIEFEPKRKAEGLAMLRSVIEDAADPRWLVEEIKAQDDARALLARYSD